MRWVKFVFLTTALTRHLSYLCIPCYYYYIMKFPFIQRKLFRFSEFRGGLTNFCNIAKVLRLLRRYTFSGLCYAINFHRRTKTNKTENVRNNLKLVKMGANFALQIVEIHFMPFFTYLKCQCQRHSSFSALAEHCIFEFQIWRLLWVEHSSDVMMQHAPNGAIRNTIYAQQNALASKNAPTTSLRNFRSRIYSLYECDKHAYD